jgi:hypothetical protein
VRLLLALAGLLLVVGLVWLAVSVGEATERGRVHEPVVTPVGVLTPAAASDDEAVLTAPPRPAASAPDPGAAEASGDADEDPAPALPWTPPDPARFAEKYRDLDAATAAQRSAQVRQRVEQHAASALSRIYHEEGRYTVWPYTHDAQGKREPAESAIPPAEREPIHRIHDAPDEGAWHLVVVTPAERPDLYDLRQEARWLGSRARGGDER